MRVLTLFSGTHSVGKCIQQHFPQWQETTLDLNCPSTHQVDILTWDYTVYPPHHFDIVWASPDCVQFSKARYSAKTPRNLPHANAMVKRTLEIIDYLKPKVWLMENPSTGLLPKQDYMLGRPCSICSYCMYGYCFRKQTAIWSNIKPQLDQVLKVCNKQCGAFIDGRHISSVEYSSAGQLRGCVPIGLIRDIFLKAEETICQSKKKKIT